jgi:AraC-like DNA-binding protein
MTLRDEREVARSPRARMDPAPTLVVPLEGTVVTLETGGLERHVDRSTFALVPAGRRYRLSTHRPLCRVVTLIVHEPAIDFACAEYAGHVERAELLCILATPSLFARTRWFDEIVQRYVFEHSVCEKPRSRAARFLVTEMTKELFFLGREHRQEETRASVVDEGSDLGRMTRAWIEAHLFEPFTMSDLARDCHASESTLLRAFRRELGVPPLTYARDRRLDEARSLLEAQRYAVGEVATRVGYTSLSAFTSAFRRRFGERPSSLQRSASDAVRLPPHGEPPRPSRRPRRKHDNL